MSYKETMQEYWKSMYFQVGMLLTIIGIVFHQIVMMEIINSGYSSSAFDYWYFISSIMLVLPLIGTILCGYGYYKVIMTDVVDNDGNDDNDTWFCERCNHGFTTLSEALEHEKHCNEKRWIK